MMIVQDYENASNFNKKSKYMELSLKSKDPRVVEIYKLLPKEMLMELKNEFKNKPIMVRKDMLARYFGFRDIELKDITGVKNLYNNSHKKIVKLGIKTKVEMVIKTPTTWIGNITSNIQQLIMQGVSPSTLLADQIEGINLLAEYRNNIIEPKRLEAKKRAGIKVNDNYIKNLKSSLKNSEIAPLITEGLFTAIVEDLSDTPDRKDYFDRKFEEVTQSIPEALKEVARQVFVTQDTATYQTMYKIVQGSDFVARYTLFKNLKKQGLEYEEIMNIVRDSFVDYNLPTSPLLKALNDRGFILFSKFFLRMQRVIKDEIIMKYPIQAILMLLGRNYSSVDLENPFDHTIATKNYDALFSNPFELAKEWISPVTAKILK